MFYNFENPIKMSHHIFTYLQGDPKKMIHSVLQLKSVVKVGFNFSTGVSESEF